MSESQGLREFALPHHGPSPRAGARALGDQIDHLDHDAVIRQAKEFKF